MTQRTFDMAGSASTLSRWQDAQWVSKQQHQQLQLRPDSAAALWQGDTRATSNGQLATAYKDLHACQDLATKAAIAPLSAAHAVHRSAQHSYLVECSAVRSSISLGMHAPGAPGVERQRQQDVSNAVHKYLSNEPSAHPVPVRPSAAGSTRWPRPGRPAGSGSAATATALTAMQLSVSPDIQPTTTSQDKDNKKRSRSHSRCPLVVNTAAAEPVRLASLMSAAGSEACQMTGKSLAVPCQLQHALQRDLADSNVASTTSASSSRSAHLSAAAATFDDRQTWSLTVAAPRLWEAGVCYPSPASLSERLPAAAEDAAACHSLAEANYLMSLLILPGELHAVLAAVTERIC